MVCHPSLATPLLHERSPFSSYVLTTLASLEVDNFQCKTPYGQTPARGCPSSATISDGAIAMCYWPTRTLYFYPSFFEHLNIEDLLQSRKQSSSRTPTLDELAQTSTADFLHEVIHLISAAFWDDFLSSVQSPRFQLACNRYRVKMIVDVPLDLPLEVFLYSRYLPFDSTAYGPDACEELALNPDGAASSLLNADSWAVFAMEAVRLYLTQAWEERWMRSGVAPMRQTGDNEHTMSVSDDGLATL